MREAFVANLCRLGLVEEAFDLVERSSFDYVTDAEKPRPGAASVMTIFDPVRSRDLIGAIRAVRKQTRRR